MKYKIMLETKERSLLEVLIERELEKNAAGIESCKDFKGTRVWESANVLREAWEERERELKAILAALEEAEYVND